jgi:hypothetical protein
VLRHHGRSFRPALHARPDARAAPPALNRSHGDRLAREPEIANRSAGGDASAPPILGRTGR